MRLPRLIKIAGGIAVFLVIVTLAAPFLLKSELKKQLVALGAESASIESLYLNIWTGYLKLEGLEASATEQPTLSLQSVETDIRYLDLWDKRFHINLLSLSGLNLDVQVGDQIQLGPLTLPTSDNTETEPESDAEPWGWGITQLNLQDVNVNSQYQNQATALNIETAELKLLQNWLPDQSSHLILKGQLNESPFALDTRGSPLAEAAGGTINLEVDQLQLGPLAKPWLPNLNGVLTSQLALTIETQGQVIELQQQGDLSLNNFNFQQDQLDLQYQTLNWSGTLTTQLSSQLLSALTTKGGLELKGLTIKQGEQVISQDRLQWQGSNELSFTDQLPTSIVSVGKLIAEGSNIEQPDLKVATTNLSWDGRNQLSFKEGQPEQMLSNGKLALTDAQVKQAELDLTTGRITWNGSNQLRFVDQQPERITTEGSLAVDNTQLQQSSLNVATEQLRWNGKNTLTLAEGALKKLLNKGALSVTGTDVQQPNLSVKNQALSWDGEIELDGTEDLAITGRLEDQQLQLGIEQLRVENNLLQWQGDAALDLTNTELETLSGNANLNATRLLSDSNTLLASIDTLTIESLGAKPNNHVAADKVTISALTLANEQPLLSLASLTVDSLEAGADYSRVDTLTLGKLTTELVLDTKGQPQAWQQWVAQLSPTAAETTNEATPSTASSATTSSSNKEANGYDFALGKLQLSEPAAIRFSDQSVDAREINIALTKLQLEKIDTQSTQPGNFIVAAQVNRFGSIDLKGKYAWMDKATNGEWKGTISSLELPPFSPYMQRYSGYQVRSGQLSLDTSGNIKADKVESKNQVNMNNLKVQKAAKADSREFDQQLGMPLSTAIDLLTDDDNNVALKVPVSGSLTDPKFGYQSVINILMTKVAKEGALSYLTASLQPYGTLISLGKMVVNNVNTINLEPVKFAGGDTQLDPTAIDYLTKIKKLLDDKDSLRLNICGIAAGPDQQVLVAQQLNVPMESLTPELEAIVDTKALKPQLTEIAEQRSENVKQHLLDQGVPQERLFSCLSEVDVTSDQPRVALGF